MKASERIDLRLTIWFDMLTRNQRKKLSNMGYFYLSLEDITWSDLDKVTKSRKVINAIGRLKQSNMRMVS